MMDGVEECFTTKGTKVHEGKDEKMGEIEYDAAEAARYARALGIAEGRTV